MSALITGGNLLSLASSPVAGNSAFSIGCYMKMTGIGDGFIFTLGSTTQDQSYGIRATAAHVAEMNARVGGSEGIATKSSWSDGVWVPVLGIATGSASRSAYLAGAAGSAETSSLTFTALNRLLIGGRMLSGSVIQHANGGNDCRIAACAVWSGALDSTQIASFFAGTEPSAIGSPTFYESLLSGAGSLTNTGSVTFDAANHPTFSGGSTFRRRSVCIGL